MTPALCPSERPVLLPSDWDCIGPAFVAVVAELVELVVAAAVVAAAFVVVAAVVVAEDWDSRPSPWVGLDRPAVDAADAEWPGMIETRAKRHPYASCSWTPVGVQVVVVVVDVEDVKVVVAVGRGCQHGKGRTMGSLPAGGPCDGYARC